jgi:DNA-binding CsgD family transcriptional regulator
MIDRLLELSRKKHPLSTATWGEVAEIMQQVKDETVLVSVPKRPEFDENELEVIRLLAQQKESTQIADTMGLARSTVEAIRGKIKNKMGVRNTVGIVVWAVREGIIRVH